MDNHYTYLLVNLFAIAFPFLLSFDKKVHFYKRWKYLFPGMFLTAAFFLAWDVLFTHWRVWGFNPLHLAGPQVFGLPVEEWMFFFTVPYASVFTYDVLKAYIKKDLLGQYSRAISMVLVLLLLVIAAIYHPRIYTSVTFTLLALFILFLEFVRRPHWMGRFYLAYLVVLFPFLIVNGILTGTGIEEEVVWYDNTQNLGIRLLTIPVEDVFYGMLLIMMNVAIYERLAGRAGKSL
jgi:lycopene cyclase domain-containing protein